MAISEQWAYLLDPGLRQLFNIQRDALAAESRIPMLFNVIPSTKAAEYFLGIGAMSDWEAYEGRINYDDFDQNYRTTLTHEEYTKGYKVERKLVDDDQYGVISVRPRQLAMSAMRTREKHAASLFNNAFSSSYTGGDGVSLCNASHPLAPTHSGDVHGNAGTSALSYDNLVATRQLAREYVDDRGELVPINMDTLVVPAELEEEAHAIAKTLNKPDTADYHANFVSGFLKNVIVWDYLTDANNWFLLDSLLAKIHLLWIDRVALEQALHPASAFDLEAKFRGYMRYSYGFSDWRFVYGQNVT